MYHAGVDSHNGYPVNLDQIIEEMDADDAVDVLEELDDYLETHCKKIGVKVIGKEAFTLLGEYSQGLIKSKVLGEEAKSIVADVNIPARPPVLCAGCPHRRWSGAAHPDNPARSAPQHRSR